MARAKKLTPKQLSLRAKWTTALRSGLYWQGSGQLRFRDTFCCLGVLCDVSRLGEWSTHKETRAGARAYNVEGEPALYLEPDEVNDAAGLGRDLGVALASRNDTDRDDFATLADAIDLDTLMRQDGRLDASD